MLKRAFSSHVSSRDTGAICINVLQSEDFSSYKSCHILTVALDSASQFWDQSCWYLNLRRLWLSLETDEFGEDNSLKGVENN